MKKEGVCGMDAATLRPHSGTPGMGVNLWGASPLYENESLKECSIPTVFPIDQVLDEGNRARATKRGKEASKRSIGVATGSDIRQSCEATHRNLIQGRTGPASEPTIAKPFSFSRFGKSRACAAKVNRLIQGELHPGSGSRPCAESRRRLAQAGRRTQQSAEAVLRTRHTPLAIGRAEL